MQSSRTSLSANHHIALTDKEHNMNFRLANAAFSNSPKLYSVFATSEILKKIVFPYFIVNVAFFRDTLPGRVVGTTVEVVGSSVIVGGSGGVGETLDPALHCSVWQQWKEQDSIVPLRDWFRISHPWFPLQRISGKQPFAKIYVFRRVSKA